MQPRICAILLLAASLLAAACGGPKDKVANDNEAKPGRDKELYETASQKLRKGRYDESRLLFNVVITTYADSEYLPLAKLAIADSFYLEGGSSQLEQAIGGYKDFAQYFPTHPLSCNVKLKIAESYMRQMNAYNRDWTKAKQAEFQLLAALQTCQNSPARPEIEARLAQVQQVLGLHELDIARFYFNNRQAYKAAEGRLTDVVKKYPQFTYRDEALYLLALSLIEQEQPEEAAQYLIDLLRNIPNSEHAGKAKEYLEKLGKPIPEPANDDPAPPRPGMLGKFGLLIGRNGLTISENGVLVNKEGDADAEAVKSLATPVEATGGNGNSIRTTSTNPAPAPATGAASPTNASTPAQPNASRQRSVTSSPTDAKPSAPAATTGGQMAAPQGGDRGSQKDAQKDSKKNEKKGLFGRIFR